MDHKIVFGEKDLELMGHLKTKSESCKCWVIFAHGSGSSMNSPRNKFVSEALNNHGYGTFLFDLLTREEDLEYENRFNISLLADRLILATKSLIRSQYYHGEPLVYFGASTGAAAALTACALSPLKISAVISRGGRPDLVAGELLENLRIPVLLVIGENDKDVIRLNVAASRSILNSQIKIIPGATHLFSEPGALEEVCSEVVSWLDDIFSQEQKEGPSRSNHGNQGELDIRS